MRATASGAGGTGGSAGGGTGLLALTLATGFVVDDAIVVLENIVRHIEKGQRPRDAAVSITFDPDAVIVLPR